MDQELACRLEVSLSPLGHGAEARRLCQGLALLMAAHVAGEMMDGVAGSSTDHVISVLTHMTEIAVGEALCTEDIRVGALASVLHDVWPIQRISREARRKASSESERAALEALSAARRREHMRKGSELAARRLEAANLAAGSELFSRKDIERTCYLISIHDNPSIGLGISRREHLAVAFREADRLWMLTPGGIRADLARKGIVGAGAALYSQQAEENLASFREERSRCYELDDGPFCDAETFFRTRTGFALFLSLRDAWAAPPFAPHD